MPKLKRQSTKHRQNLRRDTMRSVRNKKRASELLLATISERSNLIDTNSNLLRQNNYLRKEKNRLLHNRRSLSSQSKRLSDTERPEEHNKRQKTAQHRRQSSPNKRALHLQNLKEAQRLRLSHLSKRALHLEKLKEAQQIRLSDANKRALHCKRLIKAKHGRLSSPSKREIHLKRLQEGQHKRLSSPTKRAIHLKRLQDGQQKRLSNPTQRSVHLKRLQEGQKKRLFSPSKRAVHRKRLQDCQKKHLLDNVNLRKHCQLLLKNQRRRLLDPAGHIIHISRVVCSKLRRMEKRDQKVKEKLFENFIKEKKEGPSYTCHSCNRLWFRTSVKWINIGNLDFKALSAACGRVEGDQVCLCSNCNNCIKQKKLPKYSLAREGLKFPNVPDSIKILTDLEERFVCPRIPFMTIRAAISDQQYLVKGRAINVPTNVSTSIKVLPRNASDTFVLPVIFRRKKSHKYNVAFENVRPHVIKAAAEFLSKSPLYEYFNIELSSESTINNGVFKTSQYPMIEEAKSERFIQVDDDVSQAPVIPSEGMEEEEETEPINVADDITMLTNAIVFAPGEGNKPESLFAEYVEAQSFVKIYAGELKKQPDGMSYQDWVKSEIMRDDRRCASITKLFFSALKLRNSKVSSSISFCLRKSKSKKKLNAQDVLDETNLKQLEMYDSGFRAFSADRGAPAFWELKKKSFLQCLGILALPHFF